LLGLLQGLFLMVIGLLWPRLNLGRSMSWVAFCLLIYGCLSAWTANFLAAIFRAGGQLLPIAAGPVYGTPLQEWAISFGLRSAAVSIVVALLLLLWGTRNAIDGTPN